MPANTVNPDLQREREKATFKTQEFTYWWVGGKNKYEAKKKLEKMFLDDPELQDDLPISYMSPKELYEHSVRKAVIIANKLRELRAEGEDDVDTYTALFGGALGSALIKEGNPMMLHFVMFVPTIMGQGTTEQQIEWLSKAWDCNILGTYAQTELGHGTFLRGLETRADYDASTQEFVINTPTISAYKWWPGGMGHTSNYAIVVAQLYTKGEFRGLAPFIVQLRDLETHMPMPGIDVGDIGPKIGMKSVNNGYLGLKNVRVPLNNMLMKNQQVLPDGTYVAPKNSVLTYGTMMFVRCALIRDLSQTLAKASTIAMRYSAVRRQSPIDPNEPEPQIIEHTTQQLKVFPQIAKAIVFKITGECIWNMFNNVTGELEQGNMDRLPEMHALSCCLKAITSADSAAAVEVCRLSCGGHGYMDCSNFPTIYGMTTAVCTYEGENTVMLLQTSRYLVKVYAQALNGETLVPTVHYIQDYVKNKQFGKFDCSLEQIVRAFQFVAANKVRIAYERMEKHRKQGREPETAANLVGIELTQAADLHGRAFLAQSAYTELNQLIPKVSPELGAVFKTILELYLIDSCLIRIGDFLRFINLTDSDISKLELRLADCLKRLRPNAVALVDSFDVHDRVLDSALGAADGRVYERIFESAKKNPMNQEPVNKTFHQYLKPFMRANL
ncbi:probable peroxisomal acyl-coenzyme A oxidase 1 [Ceratitis capitata]|uniref:Acyl-coenzyme A oxidase n=1 Tax=Ceratitis capitata TaxID=7213 RepID=W8BLW4_CERCA|nr:probable peroxisomal acyl-coenzyme A oxidase 1 [Ceratitis capitata]XP_004530469.1 probable peroxisomal acyl-coenzyme A oxidase 1 [Ceratitis capitata]XP_004530470.1 probable peroxisomal acyl-coenzyme A oxidase 1 [Ceratitis capitata]